MSRQQSRSGLWRPRPKGRARPAPIADAPSKARHIKSFVGPIHESWSVPVLCYPHGYPRVLGHRRKHSAAWVRSKRNFAPGGANARNHVDIAKFPRRVKRAKSGPNMRNYGYSCTKFSVWPSLAPQRTTVTPITLATRSARIWLPTGPSSSSRTAGAPLAPLPSRAATTAPPPHHRFPSVLPSVYRGWAGDACTLVHS